MAWLTLWLAIILQFALTQQNDEDGNSSDGSVMGYLANKTSGNISQESSVLSFSCSSMKWEPYMKLSLVPVIAVVGLVGNTLSFIVLCSPEFAKKTYSFYLQCLAIFDTLTLLLITINECDEICRNLGNYNTCIYPWLLRNTVSCQLWELFRHVIYLMSSWLVVCFTIDRCVAVCLPLHHRHFIEARSKVIFGLLVIFAMTTQLFRLWYIEHVPSRYQPCHVPIEKQQNSQGQNVTTKESVARRIMYMKIDTWAFEFGFRFLIPCIIIALCNGYIIFHIVRVRNGLPARERRKSRYANMAVTTLFSVCIIFVLCLLPNALLNIIMHSQFTFSRSVGIPPIFCTLLTLDGPFKMIRMLNYALNFMLYGLTGRQFRREFFLILRGKRRLPFDGRLLFRFTGTDRNVA